VWIDSAASTFVDRRDFPGVLDRERSRVVLTDRPSDLDADNAAILVHYDRCAHDLRKALRAHGDAPPPFGDCEWHFGVALPMPMGPDDPPCLTLTYQLEAPRPAGARRIFLPLTDPACTLAAVAICFGSPVMVHSYVGPTWQEPDFFEYIFAAGAEPAERTREIQDMTLSALFGAAAIGLKLPVAEAICSIEVGQ
jgi:hypothetical protein